MSHRPGIQSAPSRLQALLGGLGLAADLERLHIDSGVEATGASLPVASDAAAVLGAVAVAADRLGQCRGLPAQRIGLSTAHAGYCLNSYAHQTLDGVPARATPADANPLVQGYRSRDGRWFFLHGALDHLAAGTLAVLGTGSAESESRPQRGQLLPDSQAHGPAMGQEAGEKWIAAVGLQPAISQSDRLPAAIAAAVASRDALELEEALAARGMCGAFARTHEEWLAHPQGRWLAARPCVELVRIGDAPARRLAPAQRPLAGLRVLVVTHVIAGPTAGRTLAEHGADVLHLASPQRPSIPAFVLDTGHGKRSAWLDLSLPAGRERLDALLGQADVFVQGYRGGSLARRGLGPAQLAARRPGLVYVSVSCYGHGGPWQGRPGWDQLAATATGLSARHGTPQQPQLLPLAACDYLTGYLAALGAIAALLRQSREGGSWAVHVSLARTAMWLQEQPSIPARPQRPPDDALMQTVPTPFGQLRCLRPVAQMSLTPPAWRLPPVPLGTHAAEWLPF